MSADELTVYRENIRSLLESFVKNLVDETERDSIGVDVQIGDKTTVYKMSFNKKCLGKILGVRGRNISALRTLIFAMCARQGFRAVIEVPHYPKEVNIRN
ncbi:KH domain-containing protein [Bdellovibrio bacteriovorus]|uniref:KH domain-containing protein n=1 Tax=Bdellovibrio TaxID=958 RepID=UPI0035A985DB